MLKMHLGDIWPPIIWYVIIMLIKSEKFLTRKEHMTGFSVNFTNSFKGVKYKDRKYFLKYLSSDSEKKNNNFKQCDCRNVDFFLSNSIFKVLLMHNL